MPGLSCRIVLSEELSEAFDEVFDGLSLTRMGGTSELSGRLADPAELQVVIRQLTDLGLNITSLTTTPDQPPDPRWVHPGEGQQSPG